MNFMLEECFLCDGEGTDSKQYMHVCICPTSIGRVWMGIVHACISSTSTEITIIFRWVPW